MTRKLFIVARGNVVTYESLRRSVGHEPGVEIVYDRRPLLHQSAMGQVLATIKHLLSGRRRRPAADRRRRMVDEEIRRNGWAVARHDAGSGAKDPAGPPVSPGPGAAKHQPPTPQPSPGVPGLDRTRPRVWSVAYRARSP